MKEVFRQAGGEDEGMEWQQDGFVISDDPGRLDLDFIARELQNSYWAQGRPTETIRRSIENSLCLGVYEGERQIGFARLVTDGCTFTWVCDVFITEAYQARGLGTWLMRCVIAHPEVERTTMLLGTRDAHGLYEKVGFARREMMIRYPPRRR
jgi:GNAT superfamily N-acetyltransferase